MPRRRLKDVSQPAVSRQRTADLLKRLREANRDARALKVQIDAAKSETLAHRRHRVRHTGRKRTA